jgi:hypothetical protein
MCVLYLCSVKTSWVNEVGSSKKKKKDEDCPRKDIPGTLLKIGAERDG